MAAGDDQEFSSDEIFEILTRTSSLKTLDACKCVSKNWKQLIYESSFMPLYCKRTNNLSGYFIQDIIRNKHKSVFVELSDDQSEKEKRGSNNHVGKFPDDIRILASCNQGLLCCLRQKFRKYRYYVCKPATRQWQTLPNPKLRYQTVAVAIMVLGSSPLRYKIVRLSGELHIVKGNSVIRCEIFDSKFWTWREKQSLHLPYTEIIVNSHPAVCVGKSVHWLTYDDNVVAFHEADESFDKFPLPQTVVRNNCEYTSKKLVNYQGTLGFTCLRKRDSVIELWLIDRSSKGDNNRWTMEMAVSISSLESSDIKFPCPAGFYNAGIAFIKAVFEAVFYKIQDRSFRKVELGYEMIGAHEFFQFRSDLEPVDLRGGR